MSYELRQPKYQKLLLTSVLRLLQAPPSCEGLYQPVYEQAL